MGAGPGAAAPVGATTLFVAGYLITWAAAGLVGYGVFQLGKAADRRRLLLGQRRARISPAAIIVARGHLPAHPPQGRLPAALPQPIRCS